MVLPFWQRKKKEKNKKKKGLIKFNFLGLIFTCLSPFFCFISLPIVFISKMGGSFKMMPLFSLVLLLLVPFAFNCGLMGGWLDRWICGSPHATFLPPSWFLSSGFCLTVPTLSLEGLVLCESNSCGSLTLGLTGGFYSFSSWDFVVAVVLKKNYFYT